MAVPNGSPEPSAKRPAGIADLGQAMGSGSSKFCKALLLVFGEHDQKYSRADRIDQRLQPPVTDLNPGTKNSPVKLPI